MPSVQCNEEEILWFLFDINARMLLHFYFPLKNVISSFQTFSCCKISKIEWKKREKKLIFCCACSFFYLFQSHCTLHMDDIVCCCLLLCSSSHKWWFLFVSTLRRTFFFLIFSHRKKTEDFLCSSPLLHHSLLLSLSLACLRIYPDIRSWVQKEETKQRKRWAAHGEVKRSIESREKIC